MAKIKNFVLFLIMCTSSTCFSLNITKSYYVNVTTVEPVIKTIKRYDTSSIKTCKKENFLKECEDIEQKNHEDRIIGYDVTFEIDGQIFFTRMRRNPGRTIKIEEVRKFYPLEEYR